MGQLYIWNGEIVVWNGQLLAGGDIEPIATITNISGIGDGEYPTDIGEPLKGEDQIEITSNFSGEVDIIWQIIRAEDEFGTIPEEIDIVIQGTEEGVAVTPGTNTISASDLYGAVYPNEEYEWFILRCRINPQDWDTDPENITNSNSFRITTT